MAIKTITDFRARLAGGGARPNLFEVDIQNFMGRSGTLDDEESSSNAGWGAQEDFRFLCKATSMPTQTIGSVEVPFRGRILKVAGDRTFEPWTVTVINDESFNIRRAFEDWTQKINAIVSGEGTVNPNEYMGTGWVKQLSRATQDTESSILHRYKIEEIWPSEIGSIDLSYESSDAIEEFSVTFQVQYFQSVPKTTEDTSGDRTGEEAAAGTPAAGTPAAAAEDGNIA
tara:strand:+ start:236 stop:919 length:684 start_codon:yes stop_codon:yes gene_type:complete